MFNLIHRIWLGGQMPERYAAYGMRWAELNPGFELHDWTEEEVMDSMWANKDVLNDLYSKSKLPGADLIAYYTQVADVVDYELVWAHGGWYFNTDLMPIKSLDNISYDHQAPAFAYEDDIHLVNMAMYAPQHDRLFEIIINRLPERYFGMPGAFMNATTGVQLIMQAVAEYNGPLTTFNRNVFNPIHWSEFNYGSMPDIEREYPDETIAVHEWLHRTNQRGQRVIEE